MGHPSTPQFHTFHSLRIKGFADADTLCAMTALPPDDVELHLSRLAGDDYVTFREKRSLWQLTPDGRAAHVEQLAADLDGIDVEAELASAYPDFVAVNADFKELCGAWQLRDGTPNDHSDEGYDTGVIERLAALHDRAHPIVLTIGDVFDRLEPYAPRLESVLEEVRAGDTNKFTGVMCNSYHDVWMELHEDLILTQGIDRNAEGSF